jgi:ABC-2 type transport system ATP-binding protein
VNEYILKLSDLTKSYKKGLGFKRFYGLKHFSLEIQRGEVLGVIGPNGAGKTTTFKLILGLIHPDRGSVQFGPALARNGAEPKAKIGFLPENPYFYSYLTVEESLDFYGRLFAFTAAERKRKVEALLERVNMTHARKRPLGKVSRGMLQRVGIAQALINDPELLILDEPMSGLDPIGRKEIRDIIIDYGRQGKTVIFSSHILSDVEMICDRVAMIMDGQLKASGATDTVLDQGAREWEIEYAGPALEMDALAPRGTWRIDQKGRKQIIRVYEEPVALRLMDAIRAVEGGKLLAFNPKRAALENIYASTAGVTRDA